MRAEDALQLAKSYVKKSLAGAGALKGEDGRSAYQVAVDNGFEGSETEWLNSLKGGMVQGDWEQTDETADNYIRNKPEDLVQDSNYIHTDNNYSDDEKEKLQNLENYDDTNIKSRLSSLETNSASKIYVNEQIANSEHLKREIVEEIPTISTAKENIIYMYKDNTVTGSDKYKEYMLIDGNVVMIGDTSVDLTNYTTKQELETEINNRKNAYLELEEQLDGKTEANIKKNPNSTTGDIISTHLTVGSRSEGAIGANSFVSGENNIASENKTAVIGGNDNAVKSSSSVILGGFGSEITDQNAAIVGGCENKVIGIMGSILGGIQATASDDNVVVGRKNITPRAGSLTGTSGDVFVVGIGDYSSDGDTSTQSNGFRVDYAGNTYSKLSANSTGADYAECFEWVDGNPENEDRVGLMTAFEGDKIRLANSSDPIEIIGIISAVPAVVGDNYADEWCGKYQKDKYGRMITEHKVYAEVLDDEGNVVRKGYEADEYVLNPDYNPDEKYIPRLERPEYDAVGTHGKLVVRDDGSCEVGGFCRSGENGIATASESGFYVMERIDDETIRVYIK